MLKYSLRLSILIIAGFSTYASVVGLGALFATISIPVMLVGVALEIGKYASINLVYTNWKIFTFLNRSIMLTFISLLMMFTSAGVFSFLGMGFQGTSATLSVLTKDTEAKLQAVEEAKAKIQSIDKQIAELPNTSVTGRIRLINTFKANRDAEQAKLDKLNAELEGVNKTISEAELHAGPITYLASATGKSVESIATIIIMLLTICLDPFAIFLTYLYSKVYIEQVDNKPEPLKDKPSNVIQPTTEEVEQVEEEPIVSTVEKTTYEELKSRQFNAEIVPYANENTPSG